MMPACSCGGCFSYQPIVCTPAWPDCADAAAAPHATWGRAFVGYECVIACEPGWADCDQVSANGCEVHADTCLHDSGPGADPVLLASVAQAPSGLARCGGEIVWVEGRVVRAAPALGGAARTVGPLDASAASGLACGDGWVWLGLGASEAGADGELVRVSLGALETIGVVANVEPGYGIERDDASTYWLARADGGAVVVRTVEDAGSTALVASDERPDLFKTFAIGDGIWSAAGGDLLHLHDGSVDALEAGALAVAARGGDAGDVVALVSDGDGGVELRALADGGLGAALARVDAPRVITAWGDVVFVATDDRVVMVPATGAPKEIAKGLAHVVALVADANRVYWAVRGPPAGVWSAAWP